MRMLMAIVISSGCCPHKQAAFLYLQERNCGSICSPVISDVGTGGRPPCRLLPLGGSSSVDRRGERVAVPPSGATAGDNPALPGLRAIDSSSWTEGPGDFPKRPSLPRGFGKELFSSARGHWVMNWVGQESGQAPGGPAFMDRCRRPGHRQLPGRLLPGESPFLSCAKGA